MSAAGDGYMIRVKFSRWPWQWYLPPDPMRSVTPAGKRYGWRSGQVFMDRFGGGWQWKLGVDVGGKTVILNLLIGIVRLSWGRP